MVTAPRGLPAPGTTGPDHPLDGPGRPVPRRGISLLGLVILVVGLAAAAKGVWIVLGPDLSDVNGVWVKAFGEGEQAPRGESGPAGRTAPGSPVAAPRLALLGIILPGYALIGIDGRPQRAFTVGQEIVAGSFLRTIYRDRVLIERDGKPEFLFMQDARTGGRWVKAPRPEDFPGVEAIGKNQYRVSREHVNAQMRNPEIMSDARLDLYPGGGFIVNAIRPDSVYEKLGLQAGDVIRTVNGAAVNSVADAIRLYQQIYQFNQVRLGIVRGGQPVQLSYNLH